MKPEGRFIAERAAAQHCAELLRPPPGPDALAPLLTRAGEKFARALGPALAPLVGGKGATVKCPAAKASTVDDLTMFNPELAANTLFALGAEGLPMLVSLDAAAVLRMVDRTFGGRGEAPSPLPDSFPVSADLLMQRLDRLVAQHLGEAIAPAHPDFLRPLRRDGSLAMLDAFPRTDPVMALEIEVTEPGGEHWVALVALPLPTLLAAFAPATGGSRAAQSTPRGPADPLAEPFASLALPLRAVLVDMRLPMSTLAALRPGTVLPVAVARQVPLRLGAVTLATGTVGAADDRVALQITNAF